MASSTLEKYSEVEENFYNDLMGFVGRDLLFYCVTGSLGRKDVISDWSDIDIILVFQKLDESTLDYLSKAIKLNKTDIKIGTTFYSLKEWNVYKFQDPKTFDAMHYVFSGIYSPRISNSKVLLNQFPIEMLNTVNRISLSSELCILKRALLDKQEEKIIYKRLSTILRIFLLDRGVIAGGYQDVWNKSKIYFTDFPLSQITPEEIMISPEKYIERTKHYFRFLEWLGGNS
ncbi:MAG: hypothetical protein Q8Q90_03365 [bacterium]|nr:hypothetical protein [bacterium]